MNKVYSIFLNKKLIGTTYFERADASMGAVGGTINFNSEPLTFEFFRQYCADNQIETMESIGNKWISTQHIPKVTVFNENELEIKGESCCIIGCDIEGFEIGLAGIPYPFYESEFPHHVQADKERFTDTQPN